MATWADVRRVALSLPETAETAHKDGAATWTVRGKSFAWERLLRASDLATLAKLGRDAPEGPILGVRTASLEMKEALIAADPAIFTIPHFDGYAAVLVRLKTITVPRLRAVLTEGWLSRAPARLAATLPRRAGL